MQRGHLSPVRALEASWGWDLAPSWAVGHSSSPICPEWKPQPPPQWLCAPNSCPGPPPTRSHLSEKGTWRPQAQVGLQPQIRIRLPGYESKPWLCLLPAV